MRGLVLLLLGGGLIWAVLTFFPKSEDGAGPVIEGQPTTAAEELEGGESKTQAAPAKPQPKPAAAVTPQPKPTQDGFAVPVAKADLIEIGSIIAHRGPGGVKAWLADSGGMLGDDMGHALMAFSLGAAGDRKSAREHAKRISSADALPMRVRWALQRLLSGEVASPWPASVRDGTAMEEGLIMRLALVEASALAKQRKESLAAQRLTVLFLGELNGAWEADFASLKVWKRLLDQIQARHRWNPKGVWPSEQLVVQGGDSLAAIRKRYIAKHPDRLICTGLMARVNGIDPDMIHPDDVLRIPTDTVSMLVDLDAHWLLYFHGNEVVAAYPVGIGAEGNETILGEFTIGEKQEEPTWFRRNEAPIVFGEEGNPLGTRYMTWFQSGVKTHFGFHGTWEPETIGGNESQGCIRMTNADVEQFFDIVPQGTQFFVQQ